MKNKQQSKMFHRNISTSFSTPSPSRQTPTRPVLSATNINHKTGLKKAFTLVELIVVITILAILATIGFVSYSGYLAGIRDVNRTSQLKSISDALELYRINADLPSPENAVDIKYNGNIIASQGYIGKNILQQIEYTTEGIDPKDKTFFSYYLTADKKEYQLMAFLEESNKEVVAKNSHSNFSPHPSPLPRGEGIVASLLNQANAGTVDYSKRFPTVYGKKLGILTDTTNTPLQEIPSVIASGSIDVSTTTLELKSYLKDNEYVIKPSSTELEKLRKIDKVGGKGWTVNETKTEFVYNGGTNGGTVAITCSDGTISQYMCANTNDSQFTLGTGTETGTVTDSVTGLMWQRQASTDEQTTCKTYDTEANTASDTACRESRSTTYGDDCNQCAAKAYCANLTLGGYTDWRLPDTTELFSIVDYAKYNPAIDTTKITTANSYYWSPTTSSNSTGYAWIVSFDYAYSYYYDKSYNFYVRCVR